MPCKCVQKNIKAHISEYEKNREVPLFREVAREVNLNFSAHRSIFTIDYVYKRLFPTKNMVVFTVVFHSQKFEKMVIFRETILKMMVYGHFRPATRSP